MHPLIHGANPSQNKQSQGNRLLAVAALSERPLSLVDLYQLVVRRFRLWMFTDHQDISVGAGVLVMIL